MKKGIEITEFEEIKKEFKNIKAEETPYKIGWLMGEIKLKQGFTQAQILELMEILFN